MLRVTDSDDPTLAAMSEAIRVALAKAIVNDIGAKPVAAAMPAIAETEDKDEEERNAKDFEAMEGHTEAEVVIDDEDGGRIAENVKKTLEASSNEVERKKRAENRKETPKYRIEQHNLLHQPSEPTWCDACAEGKTKKKAATRVKEEEVAEEDEKPTEEKWGVRLDGDLSGKTQTALGKEVMAFHQKGQQTEYAGVEGLTNKEPETVRDAFNEHNSGHLKETETFGSDNGPEFEGPFHNNLVDHGVRHAQSVPHRPQTHSTIERWLQDGQMGFAATRLGASSRASSGS